MDNIPSNEELALIQDLHSEKCKYYTQARKLAEKEEPFFEILQLSVRCQLLKYQREGIVNVTTSGCIDMCEGKNGKTMTIKKALKTLPLPARRCKNHRFNEKGRGFCMGDYQPVIEFDDIKKDLDLLSSDDRKKAVEIMGSIVEDLRSRLPK